jgi:hypothetical protein
MVTVTEASQHYLSKQKLKPNIGFKCKIPQLTLTHKIDNFELKVHLKGPIRVNRGHLIFILSNSLS